MATGQKLRLYLDGVETEHDTGTFLAVYEQAMQRLNEEERIIIGISINGVEVLPDSLGDIAHDEITQAVISSQPMVEFAEGLANTAFDYLPKLKQGLISVSRLFQEGRDEDAHTLFVEAVEGLEWINSCLGGLGAWLAQKGSVELLQLHGTYQGQLADLGAAMEQKNLTDVADLLEYEVAETLSKAMERMQELKRLLDTMRKGS
ncbi:hypothetical protein [Tumebacillus avium]|nr:hypothetical protein [Tumebacillus avium]